jgi:hypothetical protein
MGLVRRNRGCARKARRTAGRGHGGHAQRFFPAGPFQRLNGQRFSSRSSAFLHFRRAPARRRNRAVTADKIAAHAHLRKIKVALTPPKPKELESTDVHGASRGCVTRGNCTRVGRFQREFRRQPLSAQRHQADDRFHRARRAEQMADAGLGGTDRQSRGARGRPAIDGGGLGAVVERRAGAVGVDVINVRRRQARDRRRPGSWRRAPRRLPDAAG